VAKANINMLLYGVRHPLVWTVTDSVTDSTVDGLLGRVPLILTNPPFGEGKYDSPAGVAAAAEVLPRLAGRSRIDPSVACLARALRLLAPGGVLGIVLPDGVITSAPVDDVLGGATPMDVNLLASVSLPTATFALSGTVAKTSVLFFRRGVSPRGHRVALARVEHVGYLRQAGRAAPDPEGDELPAVATLVADALTTAAVSADTPASTPGNSPHVAASQIMSRTPLVAVVPVDRLTDLSRLDPDAIEARQSVISGGGVSLAEYLASVPPRRCREVSTPFVSVLHVDDLGTVDWHAARNHAPLTPGVIAEPGEIIVSLLNPAHLRATVVPSGEALQVSAEFGAFRSTVDPYAILGLLYSQRVRIQLRPLGTGTSSSRRRIGPDDLLSVVVPRLEPSTLEALAAKVRSAQQQITVARAGLRSAYGIVTQNPLPEG
jgi:hypothetical protein